MTLHKCSLASHLDLEQVSEAVAGFPYLLQASSQLRSLQCDSEGSFVYTTTLQYILVILGWQQRHPL